jgi:hypothetical protein
VDLGFANATAVVVGGSPVNVVSPGSIASEALVGWAESVGVDGSDPHRLVAAVDEHFGHPAHLPRAGLPDEIAPVAAFLASRRNSIHDRGERERGRRVGLHLISLGRRWDRCDGASEMTAAKDARERLGLLDDSPGATLRKTLPIDVQYVHTSMLRPHPNR